MREEWVAMRPVTGLLTLQLQMKLKPGSLFPGCAQNKTLLSKWQQQLGKNYLFFLFFLSTNQTITGPYQLLLKMKHGLRAVHYTSSRAVCNHALSGFGRSCFTKIKPNSESIHFSHSIQQHYFPLRKILCTGSVTRYSYTLILQKFLKNCRKQVKKQNALNFKLEPSLFE